MFTFRRFLLCGLFSSISSMYSKKLLLLVNRFHDDVFLYIRQELPSMIQRSGRRITPKPSRVEISTDRPATTSTAFPFSNGPIVPLSTLRPVVPTPTYLHESTGCLSYVRNCGRHTCGKDHPSTHPAICFGTRAGDHKRHKICRMSSCYQVITFISHHQLLRCRLIDLLMNLIPNLPYSGSIRPYLIVLNPISILFHLIICHL